MSPSVEPFNEARYKALMDGLECSEIKRSELERTLRIDSEFYSKSAIKVSDMLQSQSHDLLTKFVNVSDGNHMGISDYFIDEGVPYYRGQDAGAFFIENSNPICIDEKTFELPVMKRSHLKKGDVILSIVGTIGSLSLVYSDKSATCSCKLAILRPKEGKNAELLATFLRGKYGQAQIARFTRGAVQKGLILEDMDQLVVPVFGDGIVEAIRNAIQSAYQIQEKANICYRDAQRTLVNSVGLISAPAESVSVRDISTSFYTTGRLDAEYYQPKYDEYLSLITNCKNGFSTIKDEFLPIKEICDRRLAEYQYIEIGDVNINTGSASYNTIATDDLPDNAKLITQKEDIIVSTVRPNRGAVAILEDDGLLVSGAFTVLRERGAYKKEVLQVLLRTPLYRDWLLRYNVGTSYPVIKDDDVLNMPIPLFEDMIQTEIAAKVQESFALRHKSKQLLVYAKQAVEMAIEQGEDAALKWLKDKVE